ncbi:MAG: DUF302 domain-containing protein [Alphaproteobacteria bacterium]
MTVFPTKWLVAAAMAIMAAFGMPQAATADMATPYPGTKIIETGKSYGDLVKSLNAAVKANKMGLVTRASATVGAKSLGKTIPGNMVVGVYRPDFAIRMLKASVPAGIEAPIRFYITEDPASGKATLTYRTSSSVFNPYKNADLDAMAKELDAIFAKIAADATK